VDRGEWQRLVYPQGIAALADSSSVRLEKEVYIDGKA